jgi:hypothetical protein
LTSASGAAAQCPDALPPSVVNSVRNPQARAAAQGFRINAAMIAQAGGLPTMIEQVKGQITADQAIAAEERRNQVYLAQNGMGNDKRAADGRLMIEMMEDAHRLNTTTLQILECHARITGTSQVGVGAAFTSPIKGGGLSERTGGGESSPRTLAQPGANLGEALENLSRTFRDKAMINASPEVAAFYAKQDAMRANNEANMAAMTAGQAHGRDEARRGSVDEQMKMVTSVVKGWRAPAGYSHAGAIDTAAIQDPFAAEARIQAVEAAMAKSGLAWDRLRGLARVGEQRTLCAGRLQVGDYPVLIDGTLLDTAERIDRFLSVCGDVSVPLLVVRENGNVQVRK